MTVEADIHTLLGSLVGTRVFPDVAPLSTPRPYITYQQIGGQSINYVGSEIPDSRHSLFQVNVWHDTRLGVSALRQVVEDTLRQATVFTARPESEPISQHEPDLNLYGTIQDFSIWSQR